MKPALAAVVAVTVLACSLAVDTSDISDCPEDTKPCDGVCVDVDTAAYGCSLDDCRACGEFDDNENGVYSCSPLGECLVEGCVEGFELDANNECQFVLPDCDQLDVPCPSGSVCRDGECVQDPALGAGGAAGATSASQ